MAAVSASCNAPVDEAEADWRRLRAVEPPMRPRACAEAMATVSFLLRRSLPRLEAADDSRRAPSEAIIPACVSPDVFPNARRRAFPAFGVGMVSRALRAE